MKVYCYGCNKTFKTKKAFDAHKHPKGFSVKRKVPTSNPGKKWIKAKAIRIRKVGGKTVVDVKR